MAVGENGNSAMIKDPGGAMVGAWQPGTQKGFEVTGEPGTPAWFELHTRDYDTSVDFYRDVFEWDAHTVSDTDEFRYTTLGEGENQLAGIMDDSIFPGDDPPAHWAVYFAVSDADATLDARRRARRHGRATGRGHAVRAPRTGSPTRPGHEFRIVENTDG